MKSQNPLSIHPILGWVLVFLSALSLVEISVWAGGKGRSGDAERLSHEKLDRRCAELQGLDCRPDGYGEKRGPGSSAYQRSVMELRETALQNQLGGQRLARTFYFTPATQVYTSAMDFIDRVDGCSRDRVFLESVPPLVDDRRMQLTKLLAAVQGLSATQRALKDSMGTKSIKNGTERQRETQDTHLIGNLPHPKFELTRVGRNGQEKLTILRMGTQTIDTPKEEELHDYRTARVNPEFQSFIHGIKKEGKQHVYVNLQMSVERGGIMGLFGGGFGDYPEERARSEALHRFSRGGEVSRNRPGDALVVISLDKNSHFYQYFPPKGQIDHVVSALAERFFPREGDEAAHWLRTGMNLTDLWTKDTGNCNALPGGRLAPNPCKERIKSEFIRDLALIARDLFGQNASLDSDQSKALVDLAYQYIIDRSSKKATSMNMSCKSGVDRAGGVNANVYLMSILKDICDRKSASQIHEKIMNLRHVFFSDAVLYNGRPVNDDRLERFQNSAGVIINSLMSRMSSQNPSCLPSSKTLLFSGDSLVSTFDQDRAKKRPCLRPEPLGQCVRHGGTDYPVVDHLGSDLERIRESPSFGMPRHF